MGEAVRRLAACRLEAFLRNAPGAACGEDPEALHCARIAIRRLRYVLRTFRGPLKGTGARQAERDLQRVNRALGSVRDSDVGLELMGEESVVRAVGENRRWPRFLEHHRQARRLRLPVLRRHLRGSSYAALKRRLERLVTSEIPAVSSVRSPEGLARRALEKALARALKIGRWRRSGSLKKVHRLRIELRRIRYLTEDFQDILGPEGERLRRRAHRIERSLGRIRDLGSAQAHLAEYGPPAPRALLRELDRLACAERKTVESRWTRLAEPRFLRAVGLELKG